LDEKILIQNLKDGSISAFNRIFSLYHKRAYNFCLHFYKTPDEAKEIVQKAFVALWEQRANIDENKPVAAYLFSIAKYMIYQELRQQVYAKSALEHLILCTENSSESTKNEVLYNELSSFFKSKIEMLPEKQKEIFKLSRFSGLSYRQIASRMNITENTVDTQIRRSLDFLRKEYKRYYL